MMVVCLVMPATQTPAGATPIYQTAADGVENDEGFYAAAYLYQGEIIISHRGTDNTDVLTGGDGNDHVHGGGSDTISSSSGADSLWGDDGDDTINADGAQAFYGGEGEERITSTDMVTDGTNLQAIVVGGGSDDWIKTTGASTSQTSLLGASINKYAKPLLRSDL